MHSVSGFFLPLDRESPVRLCSLPGLRWVNRIFIFVLLMPAAQGFGQGDYQKKSSPLIIDFTGRNEAEIKKVKSESQVLVGERKYNIETNFDKWEMDEEVGQQDVVQKHSASRWGLDGKAGGWELTKDWILPFDFRPEEEAQRWLDANLENERQGAERQWDRMDNKKRKQQLGRLAGQWGKSRIPNRDYYIKYRSYEKGEQRLHGALDRTEDDLSKLFGEQVGQQGKRRQKKLQEVVRRLKELRAIELIYDELKGSAGVDQYLEAYFDSVADKRMVDKLKMVEAVHLCERGLVGDKDKPELTKRFNVLTPGEKDALKDKLSIDLQVTFWPGRTASDPNSDPKYSRIINCDVDRVSRIEINGLLDPDGGDRCDLWILENYSDTGMGFNPQPIGPSRQPTDKNIVLKLGKLPDGRAFIRILPAATEPSSAEQIIEYSVTLRVNNKGKGKITHYESPLPTEFVFPY